MLWKDHFLWDESLTALVGKTAVGRVTIENRRPLKNLDRALNTIGEHPPSIES